MLSRIAESLYWIGRYVQRAEDTCRLLDVHLQLLVEDPTASQRDAVVSLFTVLGLPVPDGPLDTAEVLRVLKDDVDAPGSVSTSIREAREAARRVRETVPPEVWEPLNSTWIDVRSGRLASMRPTASLTYLRQQCAVIEEVASATMRHDEGWQFFRLGRAIEQVDMSTRLLLWVVATREASGVWQNALRAAGAMHAFRWAYGAATEPDDAAAFLLTDELFPRSVVHALGTACEALEALEPAAGRTGPRSEAARLLGAARADLVYLAPSEVLDGLPERLAALQDLSARAGEAVSQRYFAGALAPSWTKGSELS